MSELLGMPGSSHKAYEEPMWIQEVGSQMVDLTSWALCKDTFVNLVSLNDTWGISLV